MATSQYEIYSENLGRVSNLIKAYKRARSENRSITEGLDTDVLRAAVVFLHGAQEDYIRSVLLEYLPICKNEGALKGINIETVPKAKEKITLEEMRKHRGKTVDDFLREAIGEHLSLQSFNNMDQIAGWMKRIGVRFDHFAHSGDIEKLTGRRHKIVHEMDKSRPSAGGALKTSPLDVSDVEKWQKASCEMVKMIEEQLAEIVINED